MESDDDEKAQPPCVRQDVQRPARARQHTEQELLSLKEALEEETRILELLNKTGATLASKLDLHALVQAVTDAGTQLSGAQFGAFFYTASNAEGKVFSLYTLSGAPREAFERLGHPRRTPLFEPTFGGKGVLRIADVHEDPRYGRMRPHHGMPPGHLPVRSYLAAPVVARSGEVLGALLFGHRERGVFTERSERLILGIAAQAAIAIDNARLYEEAKRAAEDRARLLEAERVARVETERASLLKDEFLATLSHELRTPLNAVLGWSDLLLARVTTPGDARRGLETIARNARAQAQLIDDLLDLNRIVSGKLRLDVQRVEPLPIVEAALESVRPSAAAKSIVFRRTVDPDAGPVLGDPNRLQQIVWNLLSNAVKFTPRGGTIGVVLRRVRSVVEISIRDSGVGISPEFLPYIFERFRQADSTTTRRFGGLGIGLSIVKHLVDLHGGSVRAESEGCGKGATFTVSLPVRAVRDLDASPPEQRTADSPTLAAGAAVSLEGIKVLVVDDENDARDLVKVVLSDASADVLTAGSAREALALVRAQRPDVIVSDIGMPDRDGYDFIRDVRSLATVGGGKTPAIALTAFARSEDRTKAMLAGYQVHVSKPIEPRELVATVKSLASTRVDGA
ncbi:MAG: response regulator [Labilithrix sp.]|nr:response regulator [Labilithrix sp.]